MFEQKKLCKFCCKHSSASNFGEDDFVQSLDLKIISLLKSANGLTKLFSLIEYIYTERYRSHNTHIDKSTLCLTEPQYIKFI